MHGGEEKEARPGAPRSENKIAFRVFTDDLLVIKQEIQEKSQNQYSRDQSTQAHIGISGEEKCPDAGEFMTSRGYSFTWFRQIWKTVSRKSKKMEIHL